MVNVQRWRVNLSSGEGEVSKMGPSEGLQKNSSAKKGLIRTETPCAEIESVVCDLVPPVITAAGTCRAATGMTC